jgi:hypothetical protein
LVSITASQLEAGLSRHLFHPSAGLFEGLRVGGTDGDISRKPERTVAIGQLALALDEDVLLASTAGRG